MGHQEMEGLAAEALSLLMYEKTRLLPGVARLEVLCGSNRIASPPASQAFGLSILCFSVTGGTKSGQTRYYRNQALCYDLGWDVYGVELWTGTLMARAC